MQTDAIGDPISVVTKKTKPTRDWTLTGDIRVRFPSKRSTVTAYEQQRAHVKSKNDGKTRLLTHDGLISPTFIPTRHYGNKSDDSTLHNVFVARELLKGKDIGALLTLFRDSLAKHYDQRHYLEQRDNIIPPDDYIVAHHRTHRICGSTRTYDVGKSRKNSRQ